MAKIHVSGLFLAAIFLALGALAQPTKPAGKGAGPPMKAQESAPAHAQAGDHLMALPKELKWTEGPASLPKGSKIALLEGDLAKPEPFTFRAEMPANYTIRPHWHPAIEHITVISGELFMGAGETFDKAAAQKLVAGSFAVMPAKYVHFAFTKGKKTVIQLHGVGPWGITYVNPADDPRNAAPMPTK